MLYVLRLIVEVNVVDDMMSVHVMQLGMLHGLLPTVSRLEKVWVELNPMIPAYSVSRFKS